MSDKIQLTTKNTITFQRVDTKACTHYEIYAQENDREFLVDTIENPPTPIQFKMHKYLEYNARQYWEFNEKILAKTSSDIIVYINDVRLNSVQYTFSSALCALNIHAKLNKHDAIKVEYNVDKMKYVHNTSKKYQYRIAPIFKGDYRLGEHSLLRY